MSVTDLGFGNAGLGFVRRVVTKIARVIFTVSDGGGGQENFVTSDGKTFKVKE
jgi:hypothetical protein